MGNKECQGSKIMDSRACQGSKDMVSQALGSKVCPVSSTDKVCLGNKASINLNLV